LELERDPPWGSDKRKLARNAYAQGSGWGKFRKFLKREEDSEEVKASGKDIERGAQRESRRNAFFEIKKKKKKKKKKIKRSVCKGEQT